MTEQTEFTDVLESLVNDNETLKRDNAELQNLLAESREEIHGLQEEVEEQRASLPSRGGGNYHISHSS
jgi:regulator of replication initiation timing